MIMGVWLSLITHQEGGGPFRILSANLSASLDLKVCCCSANLLKKMQQVDAIALQNSAVTMARKQY